MRVTYKSTQHFDFIRPSGSKTVNFLGELHNTKKSFYNLDDDDDLEEEKIPLNLITNS